MKSPTPIPYNQTDLVAVQGRLKPFFKTPEEAGVAFAKHVKRLERFYGNSKYKANGEKKYED